MGNAKKIDPIVQERLSLLLKGLKKGESEYKIKENLKIKNQTDIINNIHNKDGECFNRNYISRIVNGKNNLPRYVAEQIADLFESEKITADWLLGEDKETLTNRIKEIKKERRSLLLERTKGLCDAFSNLSQFCEYSMIYDSEFPYCLKISDGEKTVSLNFDEQHFLQEYILDVLEHTLQFVFDSQLVKHKTAEEEALDIKDIRDFVFDYMED